MTDIYFIFLFYRQVFLPIFYAKILNFAVIGKKYAVFPHVGLLSTADAKKRHELLLDCWLRNRPATNDFMVLSTVEADDEWLHSFYYFNEDIPTDADFEKTMADYLSFEFSMIAHGRGYLFENLEKQIRNSKPCECLFE